MAEKKKEKAMLERIYTIPLRAGFRNVASYRKTNKAVKTLQEFLKKHMKSEDVRLGQHLNNFLWKHGIKNPPPRVTVKAQKDEEGVVRAELEGKDYKESVKPIPREEEGGIKDKLVDKIAGKEEPKKTVPIGPKAEKKAAKVKEQSPKTKAPKAAPTPEKKPAEPKA